MNILEIFSLILITSSSVLCRHHISRENFGDVDQRETSDLPKLGEGQTQNTRKNLEPITVDLITPRTEILQENTASSRMADPIGNTPFDLQAKFKIPISKQRIQRMIEKAIVQIITGDLSTADMNLLRDLNYDAEQVRKIREEELKKKGNNQIHEKKNPKNRTRNADHENPKLERNSKDISRDPHPVGKTGFDYEAFNHQATIDYEYAASNFESTNGSWDDILAEYDERTKNSSLETLPEHGSFLKPNIIFKINYNDSEFDSSSEEHSRLTSQENSQSALNGTGNNFPAAVTSANSSPAPVDDEIYTLSELWNVKTHFSTTENTIEEDNEVDSQTIKSRNQNEDFKVTVSSTEQPEGHSDHYEIVEEASDGKKNRSEVLLSVVMTSSTTETPDVTNNFTNGANRTNSPAKYKGLRWVQDNVYQVIPEYIDSLQTDMENETSDSTDDDASYQNLDDVIMKDPTYTEDLNQEEGMMNDAPDSTQQLRPNGDNSMEYVGNLTVYEQILANQRKTQRQKTVDDIKSKVLIITGRHNSTDHNNPVQPPRERLATVPPTCGVPRNTDPELWRDPYSMNMQFQLNLTSDQHLAAARLKIYKLPQENTTTTASTTVDGVDSDEKKIRISVYYYARSLKKHRSPRRRLMDSKVTSLSSNGEHIALDVKDAARHWRSNTRNTNHGLVVLVEDQEGHPLQPSHYVQIPNCQNPTDPELQDEKAYQRVPTLFILACTRYVRLVGDSTVTYEFCGTAPEVVSLPAETNQY